MAKKISYNLVIGNALLTNKENKITKEQVYKYWEIVDMLLPDNYYTYYAYGDNLLPFENFCEEYSYLIKNVEDSIIINCDINLLKRYFRIGIPTELAKIFDEAGAKLNELKLQECDVLAIPYNRAFIVSPEKTEEFKNIKPNNEILEKIENSKEKLKITNLIGEENDLTKIKTLTKKSL